MRIAICPGSFDPITNGHVDIINRAAKLFDTVYVAVMQNGAKKTIFTGEERRRMAESVFENSENIRVILSDGLLAFLAKDLGACAIVKGVRDINDFVYEHQLALINRSLEKEIETVFLPASGETAFISSTAVRDIALHGGDVGNLIPPQIYEIAKPKLYKGN